MIRLHVVLDGSAHDRAIYCHSESFTHASHFFSNDESVIPNTDFKGTGIYIMYPSRRKQCRTYSHRREMNREICSQRTVNKWSAGLIYNRLKIFLGHWHYENALFALLYKYVALLVNRQIRKTERSLVPMDCMLERPELYARGECYD